MLVWGYANLCPAAQQAWSIRLMVLRYLHNPYINHNQLVSRGGASLHVLPFQASGSADAELAFVPPLQSVLCVVPDRNHGRNADHVEVASFLEANGSLVDSSAQYVELRVQLLRLYDYSVADLCAL